MENHHFNNMLVSFYREHAIYSLRGSLGTDHIIVKVTFLHVT